MKEFALKSLKNWTGTISIKLGHRTERVIFDCNSVGICFVAANYYCVVLNNHSVDFGWKREYLCKLYSTDENKWYTNIVVDRCLYNLEQHSFGTMYLFHSSYGRVLAESTCSFLVLRLLGIFEGLEGE